MANALYLVGKLEIAITRRLPFDVSNLFVFGLNQDIRRPAQASSSYNQVFVSEIYRPIVDLRPASVVVDLGANLGMFSLYAAKELKAKKIYCFEASPKIFNDLRYNLSRLPRGQIKIFNVAVTDKTGHIDFFVDRSNPASVEATAFRDVKTYSRPDNFEKIEIPAGKLADYVAEKIDFLKCDIEGAEYSALEADLFNVDRLGQAAIEFHEIKSKKEKFSVLTNSALAAGYALFDGRDPISERHLAEYCESDESRVINFCHRSLLK